MIGDQKNKDDGWVNVGTKVQPHIADLLNIIATSRGTDIYGLMQWFIQVLIRAAKVTTDVSTDMKTLLHMLQMDANWNNAYNFASPSAQQDIAQVILVLQQYDGHGDRRKPRKGFGLVMIDKPMLPGENPKMTLCVDDILERVVEVSMLGLYKQLRQIGIELDSQSIRETLTIMCGAQEMVNSTESEREEMPQMGEFHDFGRVIEWGNKRKRHRHRTPDSLANSQQMIRFTDDDRETADMEVHVPDFRPFDQEE